LKFLLTLPQSPETELERISDTLVVSALDWRLAKIRQLVDQVNSLLHEIQNEDYAEVLAIYNEQRRAFLQLNKARDAMSATSRRRAEDALKGRF
jgi:hypothetical protein